MMWRGNGRCVHILALLSSHVFGLALSLNGSFEMLGIMGRPLQGFELCVTGPDSQCNGTSVVVDKKGVAALGVQKNADFVVRAQHPPSYQNLYIWGNSGDVDFRYPTYMGTRFEAKVLGALMRHPYNASRGSVVVGMDVRVGDQLEPALGASAMINGISGDKPFILYDDFLPRAGRTVLPKGSSFVTWTNMEADVMGVVEVTPPEGMQCFVSPGVSAKLRKLQISVQRDSVTVVSFICAKSPSFDIIV